MGGKATGYWQAEEVVRGEARSRLSGLSITGSARVSNIKDSIQY